MGTQQNYKGFWDAKARTPQDAMIAVDGSGDEDVVRLTGAYSARQVTAALDLQPGDRVLDLGCGIGRIGRELAAQVAHWQGADISANMLNVARERLGHVRNVGFTELTHANVKPLADASFDKAYCVAVFIHMDKEDFYLYLEDLARVLKPGGLLYFDAWNLASAVGWRRFAMEINQHRSADPSLRKDVARNQFTNPEEVSAFLRHAGFETLGLFTDSPWVQAIAMRKGAGDVAQQKRRIEANAARIVYTPLWTELFSTMMQVLAEGTMSPEAGLRVLSEDARGEEIKMFRAVYGDMLRRAAGHAVAANA